MSRRRASDKPFTRTVTQMVLIGLTWSLSGCSPDNGLTLISSPSQDSKNPSEAASKPMSPDTVDGSNPAVSTTLVPVQTVSVKEETVRRTSTQPATVEAFYRAEIHTRTAGFVRAVRVEIGDYVQPGAELLVLDVPDLESQLATADAHVAQQRFEQQQAELGIGVAAAQVQATEAKLVQSQSELNRVQASLTALEAEFARVADLVQRQAVESRLLDEVRKRRDTELAASQATRAAVQVAEADVAVAQARHQLAIAASAGAAAQTEIHLGQRRQAEVAVGFATVRAPFAGVVTARSVDPGDLVGPGGSAAHAQPLLVLSQIDQVRIQIPLPESDAAWARPGDPVQLTFPNFPAEQPLQATITRLTNELDPNSRTMLVEVQMANAEGKFLPGMFGQATIELSQKVATQTLPARAVRFEESGRAYVYQVDESQVVTVVPVTTGIDWGHTLEITSGVTAGQQVIDRHLQRFKNGQKVHLIAQD